MIKMTTTPTARRALTVNTIMNGVSSDTTGVLVTVDNPMLSVSVRSKLSVDLFN